jgi:acetone monooxygenase
MDTVKNQLRIHDENNWYMGTNVPGKPRSVLVYQGGLGFYRDRCNEIASDGYRGFVFGHARDNETA